MASSIKHLPVIDISSPTPESCDDLLRAASEWGFLYVRFEGLDISEKDVNHVFNLSRKFFYSSLEEKQNVKIGPDDMGWSAPYNETLDSGNPKQGDFKEALNLGEFKDGKPRQPVPCSFQEHIEELGSFANGCRAVCLRLLRMFATALKIPDSEGGREWFSSRHAQTNGATGSILRLLHYPSVPAHDGDSAHGGADPAPRCGAHTDFGAMTLLFQRQGQPGLEITSPDGSWMPVLVSPPGTEHDSLPPIVVNIGDMLDYWTNGYLKSTRHRVVMPAAGAGERYSMAYFCHPAKETELVPVPSPLIVERDKAGGKQELDGNRPITAAEHLKRKLAEAYGWES